MATLLLVEDHETLAEAFSTLLTYHGHTVHVANTVTEAMEILRSKQCDAVIADYSLPDGTGIEVLRSPECPKRTILLSGHSDRETRTLATEAGAMILQKPVTTARLLQVLSTIMPAPRICRHYARECQRINAAQGLVPK